MGTKTRAFSPGKTFQWVRPGAYPGEVQFKVLHRLESLARNKHSSLFVSVECYKEESFVTLAPRVDIHKASYE
jgi:hypothetical protein